MNWTVTKNLILGFNLFLLFYVLSINSIYLLQLIFSAFSLSKYIKKMLYSEYKRFLYSDNMVPISVLVPAYNEEETIVENIRSLLSLNYPLYEIIIINDGSKDHTLDKLIDTFQLSLINQPIRYHIKTKPIKGIYRNTNIDNLVVIDKENGGKADALNLGINVSRYPIFTAIDADSILEGDALVRVIMPFIENPDTIAVGGIVRIVNGSTIRNGIIEKINLPKNILAAFQVVEYLRAFLTGRIGWDYMSSLLIISGAFGAFKKNEILEVNGYTTETIGEDMELIVKLHKHMKTYERKYNIKFLPDPVCWTQVPESLRDLRNQRRRWQIGLMDSLIKHKSILLNSKYGIIGFIAVPYFWFFEMFGPFIELSGYVIVPLSYVGGILNLRFFILFFTVSILYGIILSLGAILLEEYTFNKYPSTWQLAKLGILGVLENLGYRQLTVLFRAEGVFRYRKLKQHWGKIKRKNL